MPPTERVHSRAGLDAKFAADGVTVDAALDAWRRRATDILLIVVAAGNLPVIILGWLGHGPRMGPQAKGLGLGIYLVVAAAALFRRLDYRKRLLATFVVIYFGLVVTNLYYPRGPYAKSVMTAPVFALVLLGPRAARTAIVASTVIIVVAPLLCAQPGMIDVLGIDLAEMEAAVGLVWFRATVMAASLLALMLMLDRFHSFLLDTLRQRIAAQRRIEEGMREQQRLERELAAIADGERRHLGQELHDGVCQQVTAALLRCQALERRLQRGGTLSGEDFAAVSALLAQTVDDAHNVARGLCPLEADAEALAPALRALTRQTREMAGVHCEFVTDGEVGVPDPAMAQHLYRIAQEALSNAVRHAEASRIALELRRDRGELLLRVEDNGVGLPPEMSAEGMGLRTMAYRAEILEGKLTVTATPGGGTRVTCRVPLAATALAAGHRG